MIDKLAGFGWLAMFAGVLLLESLPVIGCVVIGVAVVSAIPAIVKERRSE